jgi:hypothetical protein
MTTELWILVVLLGVVVFSLQSISANLRNIARSAENIDDRLKHMHPIGRDERNEVAEEDEIIDS